MDWDFIFSSDRKKNSSENWKENNTSNTKQGESGLIYKNGIFYRDEGLGLRDIYYKIWFF